MLRSQLFERIEEFQARSAKVFVVAGDDSEVVTAGRSRNVAVFNRHAPPRPLQLPLLFGPNVRSRSVEAENPSMQRGHNTSQPSLQRLPLPSLFAAHPVSELREDHRAGVAVVLFSLEPSCHARNALALGGLTQDIGVQKPAHNLDRKYSRRRGGRISSMGTGQDLSTSTSSVSTRCGGTAMRLPQRRNQRGNGPPVWRAQRRAGSTAASSRVLQSWWDIPTIDRRCQPGPGSRKRSLISDFEIRSADFGLGLISRKVPKHVLKT